MIREVIYSVWKYRAFIFGSVQKELKSKYQNSLLGISWVILNPLSMILIYTVIFSQIMQPKLPGIQNRFSYSIYLCSGLLTWNLFVEITTRSLRVFIDNANLLRKVNFPHLCLPIVVVFTAIINFLIIFSIFTLFLIVTGNFPGLVFFAVIPIVIIQIIFSIGLGIILGLLNVFFRDVGQLYTVLLQVWFWLTPIVYTFEILPEFASKFISLNPMAKLIIAYQTILVNGQMPNWEDLSFVLVVTILLNLISIKLFYRHNGDMVDEL